MIPAGARLRVVGDVHGDLRAFTHALATDRFVIQLGDLTDGGPDSAGTLALALDMVEQGRGLFLLGNHDFKLWRALRGERIRIGHDLAETLTQLPDTIRPRVQAAIAEAPAWLRHGHRLFVHAAYHSDMLHAPPPKLDAPRHPGGPLARALYGQVTGNTRTDGYPDRIIDWVDDIPPSITVYCGHDRRSTDGRPWRRGGRRGGAAVFMDTGAGKGGHLSWIDLPEEEA